MLKIAICDDEKEFTGELDKIVKNVARENGIQIDIDVFFTGEELLKSIELNDVHYDLIFLDIEMKKKNQKNLKKCLTFYKNGAIICVESNSTRR